MLYSHANGRYLELHCSAYRLAGEGHAPLLCSHVIDGIYMAAARCQSLGYSVVLVMSTLSSPYCSPKYLCQHVSILGAPSVESPKTPHIGIDPECRNNLRDSVDIVHYLIFEDFRYQTGLEPCHAHRMPLRKE
jgi:hypothetical protein